MAELLQRIPPHNIEAEQSVLGSMLIDIESVSEASGTLSGQDFYSEAH
jgi:replicative DNA helicase